LAKGENIKDAVNSFVMFLEEEQKNEKYEEAQEKNDDNISKKHDNYEVDNENKSNGFERLTAIVKKAITIITMDNDIRINTDQKKSRISVYGKDLSIVIGKNGASMDALEYLINLIGKRKKLIEKNVILDVKDYRKNNDDKLKEMATNMAKKALKEGKRIALRPMPSHERKIVHDLLSKMKNIKTKSRDDEPNRRIVIYPLTKE